MNLVGEQAKLIYGERRCNSGCLLAVVGLSGEGHQGKLPGERNILDLELGNSCHPNVHM